MRSQSLVAFAVGFLFALGLGVAGMTQPQNVVGFLDLFGAWNPALLFVMAGAILVHGISYRLILKRSSPLLSPQWHLPHNKHITWKLIVGAIIFGLGWGLGGFCPGPALVSLASFQLKPWIFVAAMLVGTKVSQKITQKTGPKP